MKSTRSTSDLYRTICEAIQRIGSARPNQLAATFPEFHPDYLGNFLRCAADAGLLVAGGPCNRIYRVHPNWRRIVDRIEDEETFSVGAVEHQPTRWTGISSVFQLGQLK